MRNLCLFFFFLLYSAVGYSQDNSFKKEFVTKFFCQKERSAESVKHVDFPLSEGLYDIYSTDKAFVVIGFDGIGYNVLGYSLDSPFPEKQDSIPPQMAFVLSSLHKVAETPIPQKIKSVAPLCSAIWHQKWPYNLFCPELQRGRALVGCVATATAQAMYVYKYPKQGEGSVSYFLPNSLQRVTYDFSQSNYKWESMLDSYSIMDSEEQRNAAALICGDAGKAVMMSYGTDASGAYTEDAYEALRTNFGYSCSELDIWERYEYGSQLEWNNRIYEELAAGHPIIYSATSTVDAGADSNHCFLVDGCDEKGFVHINWGWGGSGDGYYAITKMDVSPYEYSQNHTMIVGMQPRINEGDTIKRQYRPTVCERSISSLYKDVVDKGRNDDLVIPVVTLRNNNIRRLSWNCCAALFDADWNFVTTLSSPQKVSIDSYKTSEATYTFVFKIPQEIPSGNYYVALASQEVGREEWCRMKAMNGIENNAITLTVSDEKLTFNVHVADTGIIPVSAASTGQDAIEYYNLTGVRLSQKPAHGIYIEKSGRTVKKYMCQ